MLRSLMAALMILTPGLAGGIGNGPDDGDPARCVCFFHEFQRDRNGVDRGFPVVSDEGHAARDGHGTHSPLGGGGIGQGKDPFFDGHAQGHPDSYGREAGRDPMTPAELRLNRNAPVLVHEREREP